MERGRTWTWELRLLGGFELRVENRPVAGLTAEKMCALVAYLAVEADRTFSRDGLATLLWPERTQKKARQNLRQTFARLRRMLPEPDGVPLLLIDRQTARWNPDAPCRVDVGELGALLSALNKPVGARSARLSTLSAAAELYRGEFLADLTVDSEPFDEWALLTREWLRREVLEVLAELADHWLTVADGDRAAEYARRQLAIDDLRESAHRQLLRALARGGRTAAALAHYERLKELLADELAVTPAAETEALVAEIRRGDGEATPLSTPPVAAPAPPPLRLPVQFTPLVGREEEIEGINSRLDRPTCRLLTLVGPGGVGKSRLATAVGASRTGRYADGIFFISLAAVETAGQLVDGLAAALEIEVRGAGAESRWRRLGELLSGRSLLLILDNFEQLVGLSAPVAPYLPALLEAAPGLQLLVTSRVSLELHAEWLYDVRGLPFPAADEPADPQLAALALFYQAAGRRRADVSAETVVPEVVAAICRLVEGLPLAIEMAAAWIRHHDPETIARLVARDLDYLATTQPDLPARHRSVRAVFDHSWDLLSETGRSALAALSLFRSPFSFEAARHVAGADADVIFELRQHSLLATAAGGQLQLHELIRRYAGEKLTPPDRKSAARRRHAAFFADVLSGRLEDAAGNEVAVAMTELRALWPDVRAAWRWATALPDRPLLGQMLNGLGRYLSYNSRPDVAAALFGPAAEAAAAGGGELHQRLQLQQGLSLMRAGMYDEARPILMEVLALVEESGRSRFEAEARLYLAHLLLRQGEMSAAREQLERGLRAATAAGWDKGKGDLLRGLGNHALAHGHLAEARLFYERSLQVSERLDDVRGTGATIGNLGALCRQLGDFAAARDYSLRSLTIQQKIGDAKSEGTVRVDLGFLALDQGDLDEAERQFEAAAELYRRIEQPHYLADAWLGQGCTALARGEFATAEGLLFRAEEVYRDVDEQLYASSSRLRRAEVRLRVGAYGEAREMLEPLLADGKEVRSEQLICECLILMSLLERLTGDAVMALDRAREALVLASRRDFAPLVAMALTQRGAAERALGQAAAADADFRRAHTALVTVDLTHVAAEPLAGRLDLALVRDADPAELRPLVTPLLEALERFEGVGAWEPLRLYQVAIQALKRLDDWSTAADDLEKRAAAWVDARTAAIDREVWRETFLAAVGRRPRAE